jgi:serine/threonine protein kinase
MDYTIDPKNLTKEKAELLFAFFEYQIIQYGRKYWKKGVKYVSKDGNYLVFTDNVLQRKCSKRKSYNGVRYEVISPEKLSLFNISAVHEIAGTLAIDKDSYKYKPAGSHKDKARAVKIQRLSNSPLPAVENEYNITNRAGHLAIKEPVIVDNESSFLVMKKIKGEKLSSIIAADLEGYSSLTTRQRIDLSIALLQALKNQVTDKSIVHIDIKPDNIFVDMKEPITVTIFDYGLSIEKDKTVKANAGTPHYAAPECFEIGIPLTEKSDVFSMARTIAWLWHVDSTSYYYETIEDIIANAKNVTLINIFSGIHNLGENNKILIQETLQGMLRCDMNKRFTIDEAIAGFNKIEYRDYRKRRKIDTEDIVSKQPNSNQFFNKSEKSDTPEPDENKGNGCIIS